MRDDSDLTAHIYSDATFWSASGHGPEVSDRVTHGRKEDMRLLCADTDRHAVTTSCHSVQQPVTAKISYLNKLTMCRTVPYQ